MVESGYLTAIRESYDRVAADYATRVKTPAELDPVSRAMLVAFSELVRGAGVGAVADLGCGPGHVTAHLTALGVSAFGVDLSPNMIELARLAYPSLRFDVGSMTALDLRDDELGGILTFFSTHHTPPEQLPVLFAEFRRTLAPGGHLMLCGHLGGDEHLRPTQAYGGHPVSYQSYFLPLDRIAELLGEAGLLVTAQLRQEADNGARRPHGCLLARKPPRR